jgi:hypothetical protein
MGKSGEIRLVSQYSLQSLFDHRMQELLRAVANMSEPEIVGADLNVLAEEIAGRFVFDLPEVETAKDKIAVEPMRPASGGLTISTRFHIPVRGDATLLGCYHGNRPIGAPSVTVEEGKIILQVSVAKDQSHMADKELRSNLKLIEHNFDSVRRAASIVNPKFKERALLELERRLRDIKLTDDAMDRVQNLGYPIFKRNDDVARVFVPVDRKALPLPPTPSPAEPHPTVAMQVYEDILATLISMGHGIQRSRETFAKMHEEDLRWVLLIALNAVYEGRATGETFNGEGKTDILIRAGDRNVFIGECFIWEGEEGLRSKLEDQLMRYTMWLDTKVALLIFNRNKDTSRVIGTMKKFLSSHPLCIKALEYSYTAGARYLFRRGDDPDRHYYLTALVFDVPAPEK